MLFRGLEGPRPFRNMRYLRRARQQKQQTAQISYDTILSARMDDTYNHTVKTYQAVYTYSNRAAVIEQQRAAVATTATTAQVRVVLCQPAR